MPGKSRAWVLDTSALFCLKQNEPGAATVERILREEGPGGRVYISFMTLMEYFYILQQEAGESEARRGYLELKQLPLVIVESDEPLSISAAGIKAAARLSVADSWIAATAQRLEAELVHKDPEFESLKDRIELATLPY